MTKPRSVWELKPVLRLVVVCLSAIAQITLLAVLVLWLRQNAFYIFLSLEAAGFAGALSLADGRKNASGTTAWIIIILVLPGFGLLLYVLWGRAGRKGKKSRRISAAIERGRGGLRQDPAVLGQLAQAYPLQRNISVYLGREGYPLYRNTACVYFPLGELQFEAMLSDLASAGRFIFLEYFIVSDGSLWERTSRILCQKARQGVEVRLMYDDFGSLMTFTDDMKRRLAAAGVKVLGFNPMHKYLSGLYLNYRNHQKITVIDADIGYTGGTNLADEYANLYARHGHWKDTCIRLEGDAVEGLTAQFLQMWEGESGQLQALDPYRPTRPVAASGFFQPFADGPANNPNNPAEAVYRQMIANARDYVYITTPYLVIDGFMTEALRMAAQSGVDVRIVTPSIYDHWYVHQVTRSNYAVLMASGVKIYEYTPGYIHSKTILSDGEHAVTGSINMDYRSFNIDYENGVWICGAPVLKEIRRDMDAVFQASRLIDPEQWNKRPWAAKALESVLRIFAPLF